MAAEQDYGAATDQGYGPEAGKQTLSIGALTALVVGSMVGAGIFTLPAAFGRATGSVGGLIAWAIAALSGLYGLLTGLIAV